MILGASGVILFFESIKDYASFLGYIAVLAITSGVVLLKELSIHGFWGCYNFVSKFFMIVSFIVE